MVKLDFQLHFAEMRTEAKRLQANGIWRKSRHLILTSFHVNLMNFPHPYLILLLLLVGIPVMGELFIANYSFFMEIFYAELFHWAYHLLSLISCHYFLSWWWFFLFWLEHFFNETFDVRLKSPSLDVSHWGDVHRLLLYRTLFTAVRSRPLNHDTIFTQPCLHVLSTANITIL